MATRKRNELSLKQKYDLIKYAEECPSVGAKSLAQRFECGKTQVYCILKKKASIVEQYESNASDDRCRNRNRASRFSEVNKMLYDWYLVAVRKNIYPDGPILCQKALKIAEQLQIVDFKASNGWLEKFKARYNLRKMVVSGESEEVSGATVDSWKECLPEILSGIDACNIWNMDETGCFWKALLTSGMAEKGKICSGGKMSKVRVTVAFFVSASGSKEMPVVIGKSEKPRCFKRVEKSNLPVQYYNQPKAWMSGNIMHSILQQLNRRLSLEGRQILLLMDNAGCHPDNLTDKYSNIKIVFLPPNTTSVIQPLDLGIIKNFKVHYRRLLLLHVLAKIDEPDISSAHDVTKSVTLLNAIRWVSQAWERVKSDTIKKCFRIAGVLNSDYNVVSRIGNDNEDPFADIDDDSDQDLSQLTRLISQVQTNDACTVEEFVGVDKDLYTCHDVFDDDNWEEEFFSCISDSQPPSNDHVADNDSDSDLDGDVESATIAQNIKSLNEVITHLEDIESYLDSMGHTGIANEVNRVTCSIVALKSKQPSRQTTIHEFFST